MSSIKDLDLIEKWHQSYFNLVRGIVPFSERKFKLLDPRHDNPLFTALGVPRKYLYPQCSASICNRCLHDLILDQSGQEKFCSTCGLWERDVT